MMEVKEHVDEEKQNCSSVMTSSSSSLNSPIDSALLVKYDVEYERRLGKGAYGVVFTGRSRETGGVVAVKQVRRAFHNIVDARRTARELMFLSVCRRLRHDNIIEMKDVVGSSNSRDLYIVFEKMENDLWHIIHRDRIQFRDSQIRCIIYQTLRAVASLHAANIVHGDLKTSNVLINPRTCQIKLCDFGLSRLATPILDSASAAPHKLSNNNFEPVPVANSSVSSATTTNSSTSSINSSASGSAPANSSSNKNVAAKVATTSSSNAASSSSATLWLGTHPITHLASVSTEDLVQTAVYRSPEILLSPENGCSPAVDMWSVGCILAELLSSTTLFPNADEFKILQSIVELTGMPSAHDMQTMNFTKKGRDILKELERLNRGPLPQKPLCTVFPHAKFEALDLMCRLLAFNPLHRITATEALKHSYFDPIRSKLAASASAASVIDESLSVPPLDAQFYSDYQAVMTATDPTMVQQLLFSHHNTLSHFLNAYSSKSAR